VRRYKEEGTTTTPFDMVMLNDLDRYHLVIDVIDRVAFLQSTCATLRRQMADKRITAREYTREHGDDPRRSATGYGQTHTARATMPVSEPLWPPAATTNSRSWSSAAGNAASPAGFESFSC
jgi:hypothetical protein